MHGRFDFDAAAKDVFVSAGRECRCVLVCRGLLAEGKGSCVLKGTVVHAQPSNAGAGSRGSVGIGKMACARQAGRQQPRQKGRRKAVWRCGDVAEWVEWVVE